MSFTLPHKKSLRITVAKWLTYLVAPEAHMCTKQLSQKKRPVLWRSVPFLTLSLHSVRTYSCKFPQSLSFVQKKASTMRMRTRRWPSGCLSHALPWHVSVTISRFWLLFHNALLYIYGIKCSYAQPSKPPFSGPHYKHFIYVMRSMTLYEKSCINMDFWKRVVSSHRNSTAAIRRSGKMSHVFTRLISISVFWQLTNSQWVQHDSW